MRIAYVCSDRGIPAGGVKGASIHVRSVIEALASRGHEIELLSARAESPPDDLTAEVHDVGFDRLPKLVRREIEAGAGDARLAREAYGLLLNTRLWQCLTEIDAHRPVDAVYERYSLWSWAALRFARERGIPFALEVNAPLVDEQRSYRGLDLRPAATALETVLLREADAVIVPSAPLRSWVRQVAGRRRRVHVVPNGADLGLFEAQPWRPPTRAARLLEGRFVVAFLGTLKPWHGVQQLLRGFERLRRTVDTAHLLVIGDGPMRDLVEDARARLGPSAVTRTGPVAHERVPGWLALAHVGVAPYPRLENFYFCPLKVVEYLAAGLPVVASEIGDVPRLVRHGRTGLLVPPGDWRALASALRTLAGDARSRQRMGRRARETAQRRHGWERAAESIESIFHECRARKGRTRPRAALAGASGWTGRA